jgi:hypothetical protein
MSVFFSSIAAKGLSKDVTLELVPLTCFVGLSEGGVASWGTDLKVLAIVSCSFMTWQVKSTYYSGSSSGSKSPRSWLMVLLRCVAVDWPLISLFSIPTALCAACRCSWVRVEGGVGDSAEGKGMMSACSQSTGPWRVREHAAAMPR